MNNEIDDESDNNNNNDQNYYNYDEGPDYANSIVMMTTIIMVWTYLDLPLAPPDPGEGVSSWHF